MKLIIVDRDGTLNPFPQGGFVLQLDDWQPVSGAAAALARLTQAGWVVAVVTLRPGLGRGLLDAVTLNAIHARMLRCLAAAGVRSDAVFFCPQDLQLQDADSENVIPLLRSMGTRYGAASSEVIVLGSDRVLLTGAVRWGAQVHGVPCHSMVEGPAHQNGERAEVATGRMHWHVDLPAAVQQILRHVPTTLPTPSTE